MVKLYKFRNLWSMWALIRTGIWSTISSNMTISDQNPLLKYVDVDQWFLNLCTFYLFVTCMSIKCYNVPVTIESGPISYPFLFKIWGKLLVQLLSLLLHVGVGNGSFSWAGKVVSAVLATCVDFVGEATFLPWPIAPSLTEFCNCSRRFFKFRCSLTKSSFKAKCFFSFSSRF